MKAFRNISGNIVEIEVDVDINNNPLLPPDTTINPRPDPLPDHYVTIVGNDWVQIPVPKEYISFEYKKELALQKLSKYKAYYLEEPIDYLGYKFDACERSRTRVTQALVMYNTNGYLPPFWLTADNKIFNISTIDDLKNLATAIQHAFTAKLYELETIRQRIIATTTDSELDAITIPEVQSIFI